jgi:uncharacterized protein YjbJ (UPF0337 family)
MRIAQKYFAGERNWNSETIKIKRRLIMNWNQIAGQWKQVKGKAKTRWGKLTDDEIDVIEGKRDQLVGKIQQRYGIAKDQAEREVDDWMKEF